MKALLILPAVLGWAAPTLEGSVPAARAVLAQAAVDSDELGPAEAGDLPRLHELAPGLYRAAQPTEAGFARLKADKGLRSTLTLRNAVADEEKAAAKALGLELRHVPMNGVLIPRFKEVDAALAVLKDPALRPLVFHCRRGRDRTGVVAAAYRVAVQGWSAQAAADEAHRLDCCVPTFAVPLDKYLRLYQRHYEGDASVQEPQ
jgi:protein tyrosine/serine phosphatase